MSGLWGCIDCSFTLKGLFEIGLVLGFIEEGGSETGQQWSSFRWEDKCVCVNDSVVQGNAPDDSPPFTAGSALLAL